VIQDHLLQYLKQQFAYDHYTSARLGDTMQIHPYSLRQDMQDFKLELGQRLSTDAGGVAKCIGIQAPTKVELEVIVAELEKKISASTLLTLDAKAIPSVAKRTPSE
jgi:hypothetical protein